MKLLWCRESWRMVRVSPSPPSRTSWWARRPRSRTACTRHAVDVGAAGAVQGGDGGVRLRGRAGLGACRRDQLGGAGGGAGGGVGLVRVVQLDDLDGLEVPRRLLRRTSS